jgi:type IV pilus assembly protein PilA
LLASLKQRLDRREEEGFTLIELMVVVLIIAILLAIAIPTFLGARNSANARAAQSNLRNALTAEQTQWTNTQAFLSATTTMSSIESSLHWVDSTVTSTVDNTTPNSVLATVSDNGNVVELTALGKDNNCWSIAQVNDPALTYDGTQYAKTAPNGSGKCTAPGAPSAAPAAGSAASAINTWSATF